MVNTWVVSKPEVFFFYRENFDPAVCAFDSRALTSDYVAGWAPGDTLIRWETSTVSGLVNEANWGLEQLGDELVADSVWQDAAPTCTRALPHRCVTSGVPVFDSWALGVLATNGDSFRPEHTDADGFPYFYYELPLDQWADRNGMCNQRVSIMVQAGFEFSVDAPRVYLSWSNPMPNSTASADYVVLGRETGRSAVDGGNEASRLAVFDVYLDPSQSCAQLTLWMGVRAADIVTTTTEAQLRVTVDARWGQFQLISAADLASRSARGWGDGYHNEVRVTCDVTDIDSGTSTSQLFQRTVAGFGLVPPYRQPNFLLPLLELNPELVTDIELSVGAYRLNNTWEGVPGDVEVEANKIKFILAPPFGSEIDYDSCRVSVFNVFNQAGEVVHPGSVVDVVPALEAAVCTPTAFELWSDANDAAADRLKDAPDGDFATLITLTYQQIALRLVPAYQACQNLLLSLMDTQTQDRVRSEEDCDGQPFSSPEFCCRFSERRQAALLPAPVAPNAAAVNDACVSAILDEYTTAVRDDPICAEVAISANKFFREEISKMFGDCQRETYGLYVTRGRPCLRDSDCAPAGYCHVLDRVCALPVPEVDRAFVDCIARVADPSVLYYMRRRLGVSTDESDFTDVVLPAVSNNQCYLANGLQFPRVMPGFFLGALDVDVIDFITNPIVARLGVRLGACTISDTYYFFHAISEGLYHVPQCPNRLSGGFINTTQAACLAPQQCNWPVTCAINVGNATDPILVPAAGAACPADECARDASASGALVTHFCGRHDNWRDNGVARVFLFVTDQATCESSYVCDTLGDQARAANADQPVIVSRPEDCDQYGACSTSCPRDECHEIAGRDGLAGVCVGPSAWLVADSAFDPVANATTTICALNGGVAERGVCFLPSVSSSSSCPAGATWEDNPDCSSLTLAQCQQCESGTSSCPVSPVSFFRCIVVPVDRPCADRDECLAQGGVCTDRTEARRLVRRWASGGRPLPQLEYQCIFPYNTSNFGGGGWEQCGSSVVTPFPTPLVFPSYGFGQGCWGLTEELYQQQDRDLCLAMGGDWRKLAATQDECENNGYHNCLENPALLNNNRDVFNPDFLRSWRPQDRCENICNGTAIPAFEWLVPEWVPAVARPLSWIQRNLSNQFQWNSRVNWMHLLPLFIDATDDVAAEKLRAYPDCSEPRKVQALKAVASLCSNSEEKAKIRASDVNSGVAARVTVCRGGAQPLVAVNDGNVLVQFAPDSVPEPGCVQVDVAVAPSQQFRNPDKSDALAFFTPGDRNPERYEAVRANHKVYGAVAGDGVLLRVVSSTNPNINADSPGIGNLTLCWRVSAGLTDKQLRRYDRPRVGRNVGTFDVDLLPRDWNATLSTGTGGEVAALQREAQVSAIAELRLSLADTDLICTGVLTVDQARRLFEQDKPVVPVLTRDNKPDHVSVGQTAVFSILGVIYVALLVLAFVFLVVGLIIRGITHLSSIVVQRAAYIGFALFRAIYFFTAAGGGLQAGDPASIVLITLATPFLFTGLSGQVSSFSVAAFVTMKRVPDVKTLLIRFYSILTIVNLIAWLVYIAFVIPMAVVGTEGEDRCFDRWETKDSTTQLALLITYLVVVMLGGLMMVVVTVTLSGRMVTRTGAKSLDHMMLYANLVISVIGWVVHCLFFVIVAAVSRGDPLPPYYALLLLLVEILPATLSLLAGFDQLARLAGLTTTASSAGGSSSGSGGSLRNGTNIGMKPPPEHTSPDREF